MKNLLILIVILFVSCNGKNENFSSKKNLPNIIQVPLLRQSTDYTCGVTALQSILYYHGIEFREDRLAKLLGSDPIMGTAYRKMVSLADSLGFKITVKEKCSMDDLKFYLDKKEPVIVLIQAWTEQKNVDWKNDWEDGHYVVAIGYDKDKIYFMDPSTIGNYTYIPNEEFLNRWHDTDTKDTLRHFIMSIQKETPPVFNPDNLLKID